MNIQECLEKGLLKKDIPSPEKARKSVEIAELKLEKAKKLLKLGILDMAEINLYSAMFHSSRSLLFRDGFREKSHYALYVYIREAYSGRIEPKFLNELNMLRLERHEILYGFEELTVDKESFERLVPLAGEFITAVKKLL